MQRTGTLLSYRCSAYLEAFMPFSTRSLAIWRLLRLPSLRATPDQAEKELGDCTDLQLSRAAEVEDEPRTCVQQSSVKLVVTASMLLLH